MGSLRGTKGTGAGASGPSGVLLLITAGANSASRVLFALPAGGNCNAPMAAGGMAPDMGVGQMGPAAIPIFSPRAPGGAAARPSTAPRREADLRKRHLDAKRRELVESRLGQGGRPATSHGAAAQQRRNLEPSPWRDDSEPLHSRPTSAAPIAVDGRRSPTRPPHPAAAAAGMHADALAVAETHTAFAQALAVNVPGPPRVRSASPPEQPR